MKAINIKEIPNLEYIVGHKLKDLGVPANLLGYQYLKSGIIDALEDPTILSLITRNFYPHVAQKFDTTPSRVERSIRHAIEVSFERCDLEVLEDVFGNTVNKISFKPTNGEYLYSVRESIMEKLAKEGYCNGGDVTP